MSSRAIISANSTLALRSATLAGVGILILVIAMLWVTPYQLSWLPEGFITPLYALEFVPDFEVARQMLDKNPGAITGFAQSLRLDMAFLVCYGIFLACSAWVLVDHKVLRNITLFFAIMAPLGDLAENIMLLDLLDDVANATGLRATSDVDFMWLRTAVVVKFGAIAIVLVRILRSIGNRGRLGQTLSTLIILNAGATMASFFAVPYAVEVMVNTISICLFLLWLIMFFSWRAASKQ